MGRKIFSCKVILLFLSLVFVGNGFAERTKEVGVVEYKKYERKAADWAYRKCTVPLFKAIKDLGFSPEWVSVDIFLPENKKERDKYKRIVLSVAAYCFTPEMYEGITDYVKSGGLLITNSCLIFIDTNRNYKWEGSKVDKSREAPGFETVGVYGHASVYMTKIKVKVECPLTRGLPVGKWVNLERRLQGRVTKNYSATVLVIAERWSDKWEIPDYKGWKPPKGNQPFLTFKHLGKGACIYIVPRLDFRSLKTKCISTILKNALSKETLEWLTTD